MCVCPCVCLCPCPCPCVCVCVCVQSTTKFEARYTDMLQMLKFTITLDRLEIKATFIIKYSLSLHEANPMYPHISSINV